MLDEDRVGEGREVGSVDGRRHGQQLGMSIDTQARLGGVAHAPHYMYDPLRRIGLGLGLGHLVGVATAEFPGAVPGVRQGLDEDVGLLREVAAIGGPAIRVERRARPRRRAFQHVGDARAQILDLTRPDDVLEDVETSTAIGLAGRRLKPALAVEHQRSLVGDGFRPGRVVGAVGGHPRSVIGACRLRRGDDIVHGEPPNLHHMPWPESSMHSDHGVNGCGGRDMVRRGPSTRTRNAL